MKIAIITFSCAFNYGAVLQTYGLYQYLKSKGNDVVVIDYIPNRYNIDSNEYSKKIIENSRIWQHIPLGNKIWEIFRLPKLKKNRQNFREFIENNIELTKKYYSILELKMDCPDADLYITGSDQVWNPDFVWGEKIDSAYFLSFVSDDAYKISYSSSFGKDELSKEELDAILPLLKKYNSISVREKTGITILEDMNIIGFEVLDPTMLAGATIYRELESSNIENDFEYILLFQIHFSFDLYKMCKNLANEKKIKLITIIPDKLQDYKVSGRNKIVLPSVNQWVEYFDKARYVVTDSFHGTVFSIMFNKNFSSSISSGYNGRILNILEKLQLKERIILQGEFEKLTEQFNTNIDYTNINKKFAELQEVSRNWLDNKLNKQLTSNDSKEYKQMHT